MVWGRGHILSPPATAAEWARGNGCSPHPSQRALPDTTRDGTVASEVTYGSCRPEAQVALFRIEEGGHTWPGGSQYFPGLLVGNASHNLGANLELWRFWTATD